MIGTVFLRATGEMLWTVEGSEPVVMSQADEERGVVEGAWDAGAWYMRPEGPTERPVMALPDTRTLTVGQPWQVNAPAGTVLRVDGEVVGTLEEDEPLIFDTPGTYRVHFEPPFPGVGGAVLVEVVA